MDKEPRIPAPGFGPRAYFPFTKARNQHQDNVGFLVATSGKVKVCGAADCCGHHDECTGAHSNPFKAAFWKCHWYGERKCGGPWAIVGRPDNTDWTIRIYNTAGQPVTGRDVWMGKPIQLGECTWKNDKPTWKPPAAQMESYTCAVDGIEH